MKTEMKKVMVAVCMTAMLGTTPGYAQGIVKSLMARIYGGPKIEANASNFLLSDMDGAVSKMNMGGSAGGFIGYRISERFSVQEDLLVHYQTSQWEQNGQKGDFSYLGAEFTLYAMGNWNLFGENRFMIGVGPFVGYGLDAKYKTGNTETDLYEEDSNGNKVLQPLSAGAAVTLGYELKCGLQFNASCKVGIIDQLDADKKNADLLPIRISMGIAYRFGK